MKRTLSFIPLFLVKIFKRSAKLSPEKIMHPLIQSIRDVMRGFIATLKG